MGRVCNAGGGVGLTTWWGGGGGGGVPWSFLYPRILIPIRGPNDNSHKTAP